MKALLAIVIMALPLLSISSTANAKVRCNIRDCVKVGGLEVTLRAYDAMREGSKLNILKIRRKVAKAGARVTLKNHYYKDGMMVHDEEVRKSGRDAKKVKLRNWVMPVQGGAWIGIGGNCNPDFSDCSTRPAAGAASGTRWVGFDGRWDGVCAKATVTINGETKELFSKAGRLPDYIACDNL